jgi:Raf kinase inhibitor-like YbhB/YbcL family protein
VIALAVSALAVATVLTACDNNSRVMRPARPDQTGSIIDPTTVPETTAAARLALSGPWADGEQIATKYTCRGTNLAPDLSWTGVPATAAELALVMTDPDAGDRVHWIVTGIDPTETSLVEAALPAGAVELPNTSGVAHYSGPCPPSGTHTYRFVLHVLSDALVIPAGTPPADAVRLIEGASRASTVLTGRYGA